LRRDRARRLAQPGSAHRGRVRAGGVDRQRGHPGGGAPLERVTTTPVPESPSGALQGLRVLDMSRVLAGPFCCMMLGDHGADVIKVEPPAGDETRNYGPPFVDGESTYYMGLNRNKRSIALDLSQPAGQ